MNNDQQLRHSPRESARRALKTALAQGEWRPGDLLPTEQTLAEHYAVSRPTMRRAIEDLVEEGTLLRQRGGKREGGLIIRTENRQM